MEANPTKAGSYCKREILRVSPLTDSRTLDRIVDTFRARKAAGLELPPVTIGEQVGVMEDVTREGDSLYALYHFPNDRHDSEERERVL